jgi:hypothetical protein
MMRFVGASAVCPIPRGRPDPRVTLGHFLQCSDVGIGDHGAGP